MAIVSVITMYFNFGYNQKICEGINGICFDEIKSVSDAGYSVSEYKKLIGNDAISSDFVCRDEEFTVAAGGAEIAI